LNRAIELAPLFAATYNNRSNVFGALGRFEDALADRRRVLELRPYHPNSWTNYGISLFSLGRLEDALAAHEKAIELAPRQVNAHENRAVTLAWLGRCDEAASGFERAAGLGPARSDAILAAAHLSHFYYNCPDHYDPAAALRHARAAHDADPRLERGTLADALFRSADYAEAKRIYAELLEENPGAETGFQLAMCLWHLGERTEARRLYDRFATWMDERAPEHPRGLRQRREAAELLGVRP
jgi:tetratricopeptide (TPR) repeat protein